MYGVCLVLSTQFLILWIYFSSENQEKLILGGAAAVFCLIVRAKVYKSSSVPDPARSCFQSTSRWLCTTFSLQTVGALPDRPVRPFFTSLFPSDKFHLHKLFSQFYIHGTNIQLNVKMRRRSERGVSLLLLLLLSDLLVLLTAWCRRWVQISGESSSGDLRSPEAAPSFPKFLYFCLMKMPN